MISVILPVYNREETVRRAALSILRQTIQDIELIIVDDCSSDRTSNVIRSINDKRIRYFRHKHNMGACVARNTGIENARGMYIAFQDSDDYWRKDKLECQLHCLQEYNADVCFCAIERHNYPKKIPKFFPFLPRGIIEYEKLLCKSYVSTQTILARKKVFDIFKFDENVKRMQDFDWVIRAGSNNIFVFEEKILVDIYLQADSLSQFNTNGRILMCHTCRDFLDKYEDLARCYPAFQSYLLEQIAMNKIKMKENAKKELWKLFSLTKSPQVLAKAILSQIGIL